MYTVAKLHVAHPFAELLAEHLELLTLAEWALVVMTRLVCHEKLLTEVLKVLGDGVVFRFTHLYYPKCSITIELYRTNVDQTIFETQSKTVDGIVGL